MTKFDTPKVTTKVTNSEVVTRDKIKSDKKVVTPNLSPHEMEDTKMKENLPVENDFLDCSTQGRIKTLKKNLQAVYLKMTDFNSDVSSAIEKLKSVSTFDKDTCFSDEVITAAAYAKLFDGKTFADFKSSIQNQNKKNSFLLEWRGVVKDKADKIKDRQTDLTTQKNDIQAKINSLSFIADNEDDLQGVSFPEGYSVSANGIEKVVGEKMITVCRRPVVIKSKSRSFEDKTHKLVLAYLSENGKWQELPAVGEEIIFSSRTLVSQRAYGLPVTSTNANMVVDYLDAFKVRNEKILPMSLNVSRCGWYNFGDTDYFVDPRRKCFIADDNRNIEIVVDDNNTFAKSLKSVGSLDEWLKAYEIAKKSPIARLIVAASVAAPLLNIFDGERNFVLYIYGTTRGGKSTCLLCGASAVGNTDMVISFDGTNNGLLGRAAETTDYAFFVDEKQSADARLKDQFQRFVYSVANGKERQRANKDGSFKSVREWQNITICNGETELLDDNATEGAFTRLLQIHAPKTILAADDCKEIRRIIRHNYGHALPLVIDKIFDYGFDNLRENFNDACEVFAENFPNLLDDYRRYVAIMTLADAVLNMCLGVDEDAAFADAVDNAKIIFEFVPTIADISDFEREKNFILGFIAQNQKYFLGATPAQIENLPFIYGKFDDDFVYIAVTAFKEACTKANFDYKKVRDDLIEEKFFVPDDKIFKGRKTPYNFVQKKIGGTKDNFYRIPKNFITDID